MSITIYHNPRCSKSRQTLELIRETGVEPTVIEYLKTPLSTTTIRELLKKLDIEAADLVRRSEKAFDEMELEGADGDTLIAALSQEPRLLQRPIVVAGERACLGRPPENVLALLE